MQLAFYKGKRSGLAGLFDAAVRWWTRGPYSHVELVFPDGVSWSSSNRDGGVRGKVIDFKPEHWDFVEVSGNEAAARDVFEANLGEKYDFIGLFGFVLRPVSGKGQRWFCSEICAEALGFPDAWRFCPNTLAASILAQSVLTPA